MSETRHHEDVWQPCPPGALPQFAHTHRAQSRRHVLLKLASMSGVALLLAAVGLVLVRNDASEPNFGGITCSEVRRQAADYRAGHLNADLSSKISIHLEQCAECQTRWKMMMQSQVSIRHQGIPHVRHSCCAVDFGDRLTRRWFNSDRHLVSLR